MGKEFIYQVQRECSIEPEDYIKPYDFYEDTEIAKWSDWICGDERTQGMTAFEQFSELIDEPRFADVVAIDSENQTVTLYPGFKEVWFGRKFEEFQQLAAQATIELFIDEMFKYEIVRTFGKLFDSFIYDEESGYPEKTDDYFRSLELNEPVTFHFGGLVMYHY